MTAEEERAAYPSWICNPCGRLYGRRLPTFATFHVGGKCGWCGTTTRPVTEPRDFGHPPAHHEDAGR